MNRHTLALAVTVVSLASFTTGCDEVLGFFSEPKPKVSAPKKYAAGGLKFEYPGNWKLSEERESIENIEIRTITVESPGSVLALVQTFNPALPVELDDYVAEFAGAMQDAVSEESFGLVSANKPTATPVKLQFVGAERDARRLKMTMSMIGEKVPATIDARKADAGGQTIIGLTYAPDEDLATVRPGFQQVMESVRMEQTQAQ